MRVKCSNNSPFLSGEDFKIYSFVLMSADVEHIEYFLVTGCAGVVSHSYRGKRLVSLSFSFTIKAITYSHISCVIRSTSRERSSTLHIDHVSCIVRASRDFEVHVIELSILSDECHCNSLDCRLLLRFLLVRGLR